MTYLTASEPLCSKEFPAGIKSLWFRPWCFITDSHNHLKQCLLRMFLCDSFLQEEIESNEMPRPLENFEN